jgi:protein-L-isoaspartate(D-aspartate) O-methyltransferase
MSKIVNELIRLGYLKTDRIIDAFSEISRLEFVPGELESQAEVDVALPIGYGQTISQPSVVAFMLELLNPQENQKILDVGSGSGWTTALLSHIVGEKGKVIATEIVEELRKIGEENVAKFNYIKKGIAEFKYFNGKLGFSAEAPYDRILVSAAAKEIPGELKEQLKIGGIMVIPVGNSLFFLERKDNAQYSSEEFPGFSFVPLIN